MARIPRTADVPDFPVLVAGYYTLTVSDIQEKTDKNGDNYLNVEFIVGDGNKRVWDMFYPDKEERLWKLKNFEKAVDITLIEKEFDSSELIGKQVVAHIIPQKSPDGKIRERVREYLPIGEISDEVKGECPTPEDDDLPF